MDVETFSQLFANLECDTYVSEATKTISKTPIALPEVFNNKQIKHTKRGGYRPVLVDESLLKSESASLQAHISQLSHKNLSEPDMAAFYIIAYLNHRHPYNLFQCFNPIVKAAPAPSSIDFSEVLDLTSKKVKTRLEKLKLKTLFELVNSFNLHSLPHSARYTLVQWYVNQNCVIL